MRMVHGTGGRRCRVNAANNYLHISVVVPTRNRPVDVQRCLASLCAVRYPAWDILVVDQSDDARTCAVVDAFAGALPHLAYYRASDRGASLARNHGIERTRGEIIAFLDDDCTVRSDWLEQVAGAFGRHPEAAIVFGAVNSAPHDPSQYFVPVFPVRREQTVQGRRAFLRPDGMSASMYLRRDACIAVGPFDACLGPGTDFAFGGEDNDYIYRCLLAGYSTVRTPAIVTEHYGFRDYADGSAQRLIRGYAYCAGATDLKLLRCGQPIALVLMASHIAYFLVRTSWTNALLRRGPSNAERLGYYLQGALASLRLRINRPRRLFVPATSALTTKV